MHTLSSRLFVLTDLFLAPAMGARADEFIADHIARFYAPGMNGHAVDGIPSMALQRDFPRTGDVPVSFRVRPAFTTDGGKTSAFVPIEPGTSLYGTGEIGGPLLRNGRTSVAWNTDSFAYKNETPSLYQSQPWVLAVRADGSAFGVLADTTYRCAIDLTQGIRFTADGPSLGFPVIVIDRATPQDVVKGLADLTGTIPMPPRWAIGYHQCRYSYNPEARVREIASGFRAHNIPCDVIWLDIDYMNQYRVFTFDATQFPDPTRLNSDLHSQGFHTIWMIDPGVKAEPGFFVFDSGSAGDHWVKTAAGEPYKGDVWPGQCVFPDFTRPQTRVWWAGLYKDYLASGIDGVWNDMNEPAIFNVPSKTMPEDNLHRGGDGLAPGAHARFHNVYGMLMAGATREGIAAANPDKRPFVLTRANYVGGQRFAAAWTGDNSAEWDDLEASIPMVLNLGLSGQPFAGPDIGGFNANGDGALFARWMGFGALMPFARGHTGKGNINKEPWAFTPEVETTCRIALERRYRLLPYLYTLFHEASATGLPLLRPAFFADAKDLALRSEDDAFLLGEDLLVIPAVTPLRDRVPSLPRGSWRTVGLVEKDLGDDLPELRLRAGAILPLGPVMSFTGEKPLDPLTLLVNLDEHGRAAGTLYEDAGDGFGYQRGEFLITTYAASTEGNAVKVRVTKSEGSMPRPARKLVVQVITTADQEAGRSGRRTFVSRDGQGADGEEVTVQLR